MIKKIVFLFILVSMLSILFACGLRNTVTTEMPSMAEEETHVEEKAGSLESNRAPKESKTPISTERNTSDFTAAYVKYLNSYMPVSYVKNDEEVLKGDGGWYYEIESLLPKDVVAEAQIYSTKGMYQDGTTTPYDTLQITGHIDSRIACESIAICGNWEPFPVKVRYESYTLDNQPQNETWLSYFAAKIHEFSADTPVIITEAWFFDLNGNGIEEVFVNANNTFYSTEDNTPNPPAAEVSAVYAISALFFDGSNPTEIGSVNIHEVGNQPLNEQKEIFHSYKISEESPDWSEHYITAIQYDANGNLTTCPIFNCGEYDRSCEQEVIICDIDGNGQAELITMGYSIYSPIIIYTLNDDSTLVESFRITTPA